MTDNGNVWEGQMGLLVGGVRTFESFGGRHRGDGGVLLVNTGNTVVEQMRTSIS